MIEYSIVFIDAHQSFIDLYTFSVQKGDRHEVKKEESEKKSQAPSGQTKSNIVPSSGSLSNGATLKTPNEGLSEVSASKVQVMNTSHSNV